MINIVIANEIMNQMSFTSELVFKMLLNFILCGCAMAFSSKIACK